MWASTYSYNLQLMLQPIGDESDTVVSKVRAGEMFVNNFSLEKWGEKWK